MSVSEADGLDEGFAQPAGCDCRTAQKYRAERCGPNHCEGLFRGREPAPNSTKHERRQKDHGDSHRSVDDQIGTTVRDSLARDPQLCQRDAMQSGDLLEEWCQALLLTVGRSNRSWSPSLIAESNRQLLGTFHIADEVFGIGWDTEIQGHG